MPAGVSWKYYSAYTSPADAGIWTAPNSIYNICLPTGTVGIAVTCSNPNYSKEVFSPQYASGGQGGSDQAQILKDIEDPTCASLQQLSFVTPDGRWSDHPGCPINGCNSNNESGEDGGPSYVAAIVNAAGNNTTCNYWNSTIILITLDDWGGFYDHVSPAASAGGPGTTGYPNGTGQPYVYGFRVPLLVVSKYVKSNTSLGGYISGGSTPNCSNGGPYCHDFGSILGFIKQVFSLGYIGSTSYPYADYFAPDQYASHIGGPCTATTCPFPLADFFSANASRTFVPITSAKYLEKCFHYPNQTGCLPSTNASSPDNDDTDEQ